MLSAHNFINLIQPHILKIEALMRSQSNGHLSELDAAIEYLLASGGKRIRPAVALLIGRMLGADHDRLIALGAAIELLHTATLVHDDLIDGALMRRGIATLNSKWSPAATVLTGDYIFARAARLAAETESVILMQLFSETLAVIVNGELTQLFLARGLTSRHDYYKRIYAKTASLFELAAAAAAILSSVNQDTISSLRKFGYDIGMAFQIVDDVLDFTGEQSTIGKPVASDLRQGLITLPTICYMEIKPSDPEIKKIISNEANQVDDFDRLIASIRDSGAIESAMIEARSYIDSALRLLTNQPDSAERSALHELANYIISRDL